MTKINNELQTLKNALTKGHKWVVRHAGGALHGTTAIEAEAEQLRESDGHRHEKVWEDGSGGGIGLIEDEIAQMEKCNTPNYGDLHDYVTGEYMRPATKDEQARSRDAGPEGIIVVDGKSVYVED